MAKQNADGIYKLQARIASKYKPLIVRGCPLHEKPSKLSFAERRIAAETHLDLWLDGSVYPVDPRTKQHPKFQSIPELLEFVGEGERGLLGYIKNVESNSGSTSKIVKEREIEILILRERVDELIVSFGKQQSIFDSCRAREASLFQTEIHHLQEVVDRLESSLQLLRTDHHIQFQKLCTEIEEKQGLHAQIIRVQEDCEQRIRDLQKGHEAVQLLLCDNLLGVTRKVEKLHAKINRMIKTPFGYRSQVRTRRDIHDLSQSGGHAKASKRLARAIIAPSTVWNIQSQNKVGHTHRRLCGDKEKQVENGKLFATMLSKTELNSLILSPALHQSGIQMANYYLNKIGDVVGPHEILQILDENGITQKGYGAIFKKFKGGVQQAAKNLRVGCLPAPYNVSKLRSAMNAKLTDLTGEYYHIDMNFEIEKSNKETKRLVLDEFNNLFLDVESVQRTMVRLYKFTSEELQEDPLIFVIKMDEAELIHDQKFERIGISIMNRALDSNITKDSEDYFSVQSERELFPIGCFQLLKENFEILSLVFTKTHIPVIIKAQEEGQLLHVEGIGDFKVNWHLSCDMKTIKALYGLGNGACAKHCCIYCNQEKNMQTIISTSTNSLKQKSSWNGGLFSRNVTAKPVTGPTFLSRWRPILPIPLEQVHLCTLHAFNRICEKMLHMHFQFVWTLRDEVLQKTAIEDLQRILSGVGLHGGDVQIIHDKIISGKANSVPKKPSLSGALARKLFKQNNLLGGSSKVYQDIVVAERSFTNNGQARQGRLKVWMALEDLIPYFTGLILSMEQQRSFKGLVEKFGKLYMEYFGEQQVTHYIHVLVKHGPYFVKRYGSLSVWSCQGLEHSHYAAKFAY